MTVLRDNYPEDLILTVEDFRGCGWKAELADLDGEIYSSMWDAFFIAGKKAMDEERQAHGKALLLLAHACSIRFSHDSINEPFRPFRRMDRRRPILSDEFSDADITFFSQIVDEIDDPWLKARLADLVWVTLHPRQPRFALAAIDSYRSIPLDEETWWRNGEECWKRAIVLARMLRSGAGNRLVQMESSIIDAFELTTKQNGFYGYKLANLLRSNAFGRKHSTMIAKHLELLAREFEHERNLFKARDYFRLSADWFKDSGDNVNSVRMTVATAETLVKEAIDKISSSKPSHLAATIFYEKAVQIYRTIPRTERAAHSVDERIAYLQKCLNECGEKSWEEMRVISVPSVDITSVIENARNSVKGKAPVEALKAFIELHSFVNAEELRERVITRLDMYPLQSLFPAAILGRDGRTIARRPGMGDSAALSEDERLIRSEMINEYIMRVEIASRCIYAAHEILLLEHRIQEHDFIDLSRQSPIVPIGRELLFGKALFAGYDQDFVTALHLLVPQIEHMVRVHLKQSGVQTIHLDSNGIENEKSLSSLMDLPQTESIFGSNLTFEIKALLCDPFGPNLRNELAHGLLDDGGCYSSPAIYAWWFGLKLVLNTYRNALRNNVKGSESGKNTA